MELNQQQKKIKHQNHIFSLICFNIKSHIDKKRFQTQIKDQNYDLLSIFFLSQYAKDVVHQQC